MVLENLKDVWKKQKESVINFSESDIYKMIHKKSTSIVKWIFYISVIEFVLLVVPNFFIDSTNSFENIDFVNLGKISSITSFVIAAIFMYLFYKNYKNICVNDSTKKLMNDILKTRKTVKYYIITQLVIGGIAMTLVFYKVAHSQTVLNNLPKNLNGITLWMLLVFAGLIILVLVWLFYKLLYGILLNRLKDNYKELRRNE